MAAIKRVTTGISVLVMLALTGCASNQELMAEYGPLSCPV